MAFDRHDPSLSPAVAAWLALTIVIAVTACAKTPSGDEPERRSATNEATGPARDARGDAPTPAHEKPDAKHHSKPLPSAKEIAMLPPDGGDKYNRLIHEKSPYLLQHADNPVDWYPWGDEAFAKAKETGKPVFLSVGYSTCHWCHVMAHESFESERVAEVLNALFIPVKVDREERPDVDEIYMAVTQLTTGHGGWPNSVFLTPDRRPFWAGTYFPPDDRGGRPGFVTILRSLSKAWTEQRDDIEKQADELVRAVKSRASGESIPASGVLSRDLVAHGIADLQRNFDAEHGGFGTKPKFPPHGGLGLLNYEYARTKDDALLSMITRTLDKMALGGMRDHIGDGFARYSTDARWFLPHFEKMLYDNAQLSRNYVRAWEATGNDAYKRIAISTYDWALREMKSPEGAFWSAYDADSEGEEGKFYLWTRKEIDALLGDDAALFCTIYNITAEGNYYEEATGHRPGTNIAYLEKPLDAWATELNMPEADLRKRLAALRQKLYDVRKERIWPHLDDKILVSWNALMIGSLAYAGRAFEQPRYVDAATTAATFILEHMQRDGRLFRTFRDGGAKLNAYLDDYVFLAHALLDLHETTGDARWREEAERLMATAKQHFGDPKGGGYFFVSDDHEDLLVRSKQPFDGALPSGNGMAALVLVRLAKLTGNTAYGDDARASFTAFLGVMERAPRAAETFLEALALFYDQNPAAEAGSTAANDADATGARAPVTASLWAEHRTPRRGGTIRLAVRLDLDDGWHINANQGGPDHLVPTAIALAPGAADVSVGGVGYPAAKRIQLGPDEIPVYESGWILVPLAIGADAKLGKRTIDLRLSFQACNEDRCREPSVISLSFDLEVVEAADELPRHPTIFERFDR